MEEMKMSMNNNHELETKIIHWGHEPDPTTGSLASPIYQTATFAANSVEHFEELCMTWGYVYSRECNPTLTELESKLAMLDNAESAISSTSGMGAITSTLLALVKSGDHIRSSNGIFSHTKLFMSELLSKFGVEITFVDAINPQNIKDEMKANTKIVYVETPLNPSLDLVDIKTVADIAHEHKSLLIVDSTFGTPIVQRPLDLGADLVIHSLCCFTGASMSPINAWLILRGIKTLDMRIKKHCENALLVAEFLENNENVEIVKYPALKSHPQYELCQTQMNGLGGGVVSFKLKDGINGLTRDQASRKLMNSLEVCTIATSLGEEHTLVQMDGENLIRIALGLESSKDIINDFSKSIEKIK